jgi:hypothetical protein
MLSARHLRCFYAAFSLATATLRFRGGDVPISLQRRQKSQTPPA